MMKEQMSKSRFPAMAQGSANLLNAASANLPNSASPVLIDSRGKKYSSGISDEILDEIQVAMPPYKDEHVLVSKL